MPRNTRGCPNIFCSQNTSNTKSNTVSWSYSLAPIHLGAVDTEMPIRASTSPSSREEQMTTDIEKARIHEVMTNIKCRTLIVRVILGSFVTLLICLILQPSISLVGIGATVLPLMRGIIRYFFDPTNRSR